jgi:hypothetical protein
MQATTERPAVRVIAVRPSAAPAPPPAAPDDAASASGLRVARGAMVGTVLALFPWSLVILLVGWLIR